MITQELLTFMQQQLQAGKTREEVAGMLIPVGWDLGVLNDAFAQILGTSPERTSVMTPPVSAQATPYTATMTSSPVVSSPETTGALYQNPVTAYFPSETSSRQVTMNTQPSAGLVRVNQGASAAPVTAAPDMAAAPLRINSAGLLERFKNPTGMFAGIFSILVLLVASLLSYATQITSAQQISRFAGMNTNQILLISLGILIIGMILSGLFTHLVTKILALPNRSLAKAFVHTASCFLISTLIGLLTLVGIPGFVTMIATLILWMILFSYFYGTSFGKTIGAFFLNLLVSFIFGGLVALAGISLVKKIAPSWVNQFSREQQKSISDATLTDTSTENRQPLTIKTPEQILRESIEQSQMRNPSDSATDALPVQTSSTTAGEVSEDIQKIQEVIKNPDYALIKAVVPADFPLPADKDVTTAYLIPATTYDPLQYRVEYTSTHSLAYLRNSMKKSLESSGYTVSLHESNTAYRYLFASKTSGKTTRDITVTLKQISDKESQVSLLIR